MSTVEVIEDPREKLRKHPYARMPEPFLYEVDAVALANAAKSIAEWSLQGRGQTLPLDKRWQNAPRLPTRADSPEAQNWNIETDQQILEVSEQERQGIIEELLPHFLERRKKASLDAKRLRFKITADDLPVKVTMLNELGADPLPELDRMVRGWTPQLQARADRIISMDFWNAMDAIGSHLMFTSPVERYARFETPVEYRDARVIHIPLPVAFGMLAQPDAYDALSINRGIPAQFKKKGKIEKDDWVFYSVLYEVFKRSPESLDTILRTARTLAKQFPGRMTNYSEMAANILYNASFAGIDIGVLKPDDRSAERSTSMVRLSYALQEELAEEFEDLSDSDQEYTDYDRSSKILTTLSTLDQLMQEYRMNFDARLTSMSRDNKGLLTLEDGMHFKALEEVVYSDKVLGKGIWGKLRTLTHRVEHAILDNAEPYLAFLPTAITDHVQALSKRSDSVVRNTTLGKWAFRWAAWKFIRKLPEIKRNGADGDPFYTYAKLWGQVVRQGSDPQQWPALWNDLTTRKTIPDEPPYGSVEQRDRTDAILRNLLPPVLQHDERDLRRARSILLNTEYPRDEYHIPTNIALGAISARLGVKQKAHFFLGSAEFQSQKAVKDGNSPTPQYEIVAKYERSFLYGENESDMRDKFLIEAFALYRGSDAHKSKPKNRTVDGLLEHVTYHPLDYDSRKVLVERIERSPALEGRLQHVQKGKLIQTLAESAYNEIATLLENEEAINKAGYRLTSEQKKEYRQLQDEFEKRIGGIQRPQNSEPQYKESRPESLNETSSKGIEHQPPEKRTTIVLPAPVHERVRIERTEASSIDAVVTTQDDKAILDNYLARRDPAYNPNDLTNSLHRIYEKHK